MLLSKTLMFYKRREVQKHLIEQAKNKEVAIRFGDYFGKRPDILMYENDVLELAKKKATSFHCSEELWKNPLSLRTEIKKQEMDDLRRKICLPRHQTGHQTQRGPASEVGRPRSP